MSSLEDYQFEQIRSYDDESAFFARMGRFFSSAMVRRECGGYPLNDGPRYHWFIVSSKTEARVLGFISIEHQGDVIRIRDGYMRVEARKRGLFRQLRRQLLEYIDEMGLPAIACVPLPYVPFMMPYGFRIQTTRGNWATLRRNKNGAVAANIIRTI
ncbi:TPA: hypothetical protein R8G41_004804 [Citrobacter freundii]|nr:hypothetical protein [Citrobacter freundii]